MERLYLIVVLDRWGGVWFWWELDSDCCRYIVYEVFNFSFVIVFKEVKGLILLLIYLFVVIGIGSSVLIFILLKKV